MNIFAALDDDRKLRRFLFWYWLLVPFALFAWILLGAANSNMTFQQALNIPFFAVAFLNGCLTILLAGLFKLAGSENERTERVFTLYALAVQIVVGNLPGALPVPCCCAPPATGMRPKNLRPPTVGYSSPPWYFWGW